MGACGIPAFSRNFLTRGASGKETTRPRALAPAGPSVPAVSSWLRRLFRLFLRCFPPDRGQHSRRRGVCGRVLRACRVRTVAACVKSCAAPPPPVLPPSEKAAPSVLAACSRLRRNQGGHHCAGDGLQIRRRLRICLNGRAKRARLRLLPSAYMIPPAANGDKAARRFSLPLIEKLRHHHRVKIYVFNCFCGQTGEVLCTLSAWLFDAVARSCSDDRRKKGFRPVYRIARLRFSAAVCPGIPPPTRR